MPIWKVYGGNDAWARKWTTVEAATAEEANLIAGGRDFKSIWLADGTAEFDHFEVFDDETVPYVPHVIDWEAVAKLSKPTMTADEVYELTRGGDHDGTSRFSRLMSEEIDTILAALRYYQLGLERGLVPQDILNIGTNSGAHAGMDILDIDTLCEEINLG